jgi:hypothetical protein
MAPDIWIGCSTVITNSRTAFSMSALLLSWVPVRTVATQREMPPSGKLCKCLGIRLALLQQHETGMCIDTEAEGGHRRASARKVRSRDRPAKRRHRRLFKCHPQLFLTL